MPRTTIELTAALADRQDRPAAAMRLAQHLGAEDLVIFVEDAEIGVQLPAVGFQKTMPNGRAWRAFIARCVESGELEETELPYPDERTVRVARGRKCEADSAIVLLGGERVDLGRLDEVRLAMPLLSALFASERTALAGEAHAAVARDSAQRAESLTASLAASQTELHRVLRELRTSEQSLSVTLRSIGDAVIATGRDHCVAFMNPVAEELTGWTLSEARTTSVHQVFQLVNEDTGAPLESPVHAVLRSGDIAALANHALLVRRDGARLPIDDSAAPIRDATGEIIGVVLVFRNVAARRRSEAALEERQRHAQLAADVGVALTRVAPLREQLTDCAASIVGNIGAAFARIWTYNAATNMLELQASAGLYTHIDGPHASVPFGALKIGRIASERKPHLTNDVQSDERIGDRAWAAREGLVSFAGYPLLVSDRLVGVAGLFARAPLNPSALFALGSVADQIALGIARDEAARAREHLVAQLRGLTEVFVDVDLREGIQAVLGRVTQSARELIGAHQAVTSFTVDANWAQAITAVSLSDKYAQYRNYDAPVDESGIYALVCRANKPFRMTQEELEAHPSWRRFGKEREAHPPMRGWLAVPFVGRAGRNIGLIQLSDKYEGEFTDQDEAVVVQLAQLAAVALENVGLVDELSRNVRFSEMFTGILAHDLRNPLTAITTASELLLRRHEDDRTTKSLMRIQSSAGRMRRMIDQLLDFTRARIGGGIAIDPKPTDLLPLARQLVDEVQAAAPQTIVLEHHGDTRGEWDADRLAQVLSNLLGNAMEHGGVDEPVRFTLDGTDPAMVRLRVANAGQIPLELLPVLFDPFRRATKGERRSKGLGLGLYIAQQIVVAHSGQIDVRSTATDGTRFEVSLPRVSPTRPSGS